MGEAKQKPEPKLMPGSTTGATYFPFARKGNVLLGIKPWAILNGDYYGVQGTTYFAARLRSAEEDSAKKVVKLQSNPPNLWDAWPGVEWEKKGNDRASTTIGVFMRGQFKGDDEKLQELLGHVGEGKLAAKMADYLIELAGAANLVCTPRELSTWLDQHYEPIIAKVVEKVAKRKQLADEMEKHVGVFGMQAAILKKVYGDTTKMSDNDAEGEVQDIEGEQD